MKKRVVITGLGVIAPNGIGKQDFWKSIVRGKSGIKKITRFDPSQFPCQLAGEIHNFNPQNYLTDKEIQRMDRSTQFAVAASKIAMDDSRLVHTNEKPERIGVAIGTTLGGQEWATNTHVTFFKDGIEKIDPFTASAVFPNACSSQISIHLKTSGPSLTFSTACASSHNAIGYGFNAIRNGETNVMIAGGTDACISPVNFAALCRARIVSTKNGTDIRSPAPFDQERDGMIVSEGAGIIILEELEHAMLRGAHIYAEVVGYGTTCDAYHMTGIDPTRKNAVRSILMALDDAKLGLHEISYIHAYGSATILGDRMETLSIKEVFGDYAYRIPISAIKSIVGHVQGAAGAIELAACCQALVNDIIPPTINYDHPDHVCDLDYVPNQSRMGKLETIMLNCFGFGGKNAVLIIRKCPEAKSEAPYSMSETMEWIKEKNENHFETGLAHSVLVTVAKSERRRPVTDKPNSIPVNSGNITLHRIREEILPPASPSREEVSITRETGNTIIEEVLEKYRMHVNPSLARLMKLVNCATLECQGKGAIIKDFSGREYIDCLGGYGVFNAGHCHPKIITAVEEQLHRMPLASKVFLNKPLADLSKLLAETAPGELSYSFICNSGSEAVEGALKLARLYTGKPGIISATNSFHGKTLGALSATGREIFRKPFYPLLPHFKQVPFGDCKTLANAINSKTAAVILEPIQGEGGIIIPPSDYFPCVRDICTKKNVLLIIDEVQTGLARTGKMFAIEHWRVIPDILILAKSLGGGVMPIGAFLSKPSIWQSFCKNPLIHTSTFGGNPLACRAAIAYLKTIKEENLLKQAIVLGGYLRAAINNIRKRHPNIIADVRGKGLLIGIELTKEGLGGFIFPELIKNGILTAFTLNNPRVIRLEPPLVITEEQIDTVIEMIEVTVQKAEKLADRL